MAGGKVSSGKPKSGPPAHANRSAFRHNPSSRLTKHILALPINDLCPACEEQIEWRKRFRKYKPLTVPKRCVKCQEKSAIKEAYHVICRACCRKENKCAKCLEPRSLDVKKAEIRGEKENKPAATFIKKPDSEEEEEGEEVTEEESENEEESEDFDDEDDSEEDEESDLASAIEGIDLENSSNDESDEICPQCEADLDVCVCEYDSEDADEDDEDDYDDEYDEDFDDDFDEDCLDEVDDEDDFDDDDDDEDEDDEIDETDDDEDDEDELSH